MKNIDFKITQTNVREIKVRDLSKLPKAHLHLHFTGAMRINTLLELAKEKHIRLPSHFNESQALNVPADQRGWFRFQRAYDSARALVKTEKIMRRIIDEAVEDDKKEGSCRLEIQVDPTSYAPFVGGITPALEIICDQTKISAEKHGIEVAVIVAASRMKHPLDARCLARLAGRFASTSNGGVIGFGLSNDERAGDTQSFSKAFAIAENMGLAAMPHGGELLGPEHIRNVIDYLHPTRLGHGVRSAEDNELLEKIVENNIGLEICPSSNVSLGVYSTPDEVPIKKLMNSGAKIALGADDPLLFHSRLLKQYELLRNVHSFTDEQIAMIAKSSIEISLASEQTKRKNIEKINNWLQDDK